MAEETTLRGAPIVNAMTIDVEDYFHVSVFDGIVPRSQWAAMESRVCANTTRLLDLFDGRRQLIVYRFFFEPGVAGWPESGCRGCSFMADQVAHLAHLNSRDTTLAYVSRAPLEKLERYKTLVDLASRYALLAANAYDYETGLLGTAATLDAKLRQATDATGTGAKDIAGKAIAQIALWNARDSAAAIIPSPSPERSPRFR